jgi:hypothetical protein
VRRERDAQEGKRALLAIYHRDQAEKLLRSAAEHLVRVSKDVEKYADQRGMRS